jgi:probable O-glycosylation ligase (exosortase A-associated)
MGLRDIFLMVTVYGSVPFIYLRPFYGVLVWYWLAIMNPHRLSWNLVHQPFAQLIALAMLSSLLVATKERKELPITTITVALMLFWAWMLLTTFFAVYSGQAWWQLDKVWKIMLTTFVSLLLLNTKYRIIALTTVATLSVALYGAKGGLFTILTGGGYRVWGPPGSFIGGNNEMGLALIMTVPLVMYLRYIVPYRTVKMALLVCAVLCVFAILGTQSRGAFLAVMAMGAFMLFKAKNKAVYLLTAVVLGLTAFTFMPESWHERMATIVDYEQDGSAMGRLKAWEMATNMAAARLFGGGFEAFGPATYLMYLPEVGPRNTDAHSIYFEVLGEHGFIGLGLFLTIGLAALVTCERIVVGTRAMPEWAWMNRLAAMLQVSFVGYAAAGLFLGLAYFNFYYCLLALVVGLKLVYDRDVLKKEPKVIASARQETGLQRDARADKDWPPFPDKLGLNTLFPIANAWWRRI